MPGRFVGRVSTVYRPPGHSCSAISLRGLRRGTAALCPLARSAGLSSISCFARGSAVSASSGGPRRAIKVRTGWCAVNGCRAADGEASRGCCDPELASGRNKAEQLHPARQCRRHGPLRRTTEVDLDAAKRAARLASAQMARARGAGPKDRGHWPNVTRHPLGGGGVTRSQAQEGGRPREAQTTAAEKMAQVC
jgi:hypothetical protein